MTTYRFLDHLGDVAAEGEHADHAAALAWAHDKSEDECGRVEYLGPDGDWRWAGPLQG